MRFLILIVLQAPMVFAATEDGFAKFTALQGKWSIQAEGKTLPITMTYELGSKNSIVTEQFGKELSVISRDGEQTIMSHFCNAGNNPHLVLKESGSDLTFETVVVSNLKTPAAPHVQKIIYHFVDPTHFQLELVWKKGEGESSEKYSLTKI